jgi:mannose-1-phosphate guanylyltransferase
MVVLPADHTVGDAAAFRATIERALAVAETTGALVTLGIEPTRAETGYGYIEVGGPIDDGGAAAHWAARFIEKPDLARATALLATGRVLWNAGMFAWRVDAVLEALRRWVPEVVGPLERAQAQGGSAALARAYGRIPSVSIDTGVLERAERVAVVRAAFPWNDVGSWAAVESEWRRTGTENAVRGRVLAIESRGCVVDAPARLVALLGVEDLVVVDTPDALLVCPKARAQDVRLLVDALARRGLGQYL